MMNSSENMPSLTFDSDNCASCFILFLFVLRSSDHGSLRRRQRHERHEKVTLGHPTALQECADRARPMRIHLHLCPSVLPAPQRRMVAQPATAQLVGPWRSQSHPELAHQRGKTLFNSISAPRPNCRPVQWVRPRGSRTAHAVHVRAVSSHRTLGARPSPRRPHTGAPPRLERAAHRRRAAVASQHDQRAHAVPGRLVLALLVLAASVAPHRRRL